jgi:hypothetical protein
MEVKGTAVIPIIHFARDKLGSKSEEWMKSLSDKSADIITSVLSSGWYPMDEAMIEPTQKICDLFYPEIRPAPRNSANTARITG